MKKMIFFLSAVLALSISQAFALKVGDTRESVIKELGEPTGTMEANGKEILSYKGGVVKLEKGKVVSFTKKLKEYAAAYEKQDKEAKERLEKGEVFFDGRWMSEAEKEKLVAEKKKESGSDEAGAEGKGSSSGAVWMTDYDAALKLAKKENKHLLLNFTGSDWCIWCVRLKKEVFNMPAFKKYAGENLVLVELDFPKKKKQSKELKEQNETLAKKFGIRGFPTCIILDSNGKKTGEIGYVPGGSDPFIAQLKQQM